MNRSSGKKSNQSQWYNDIPIQMPRRIIGPRVCKHRPDSPSLRRDMMKNRASAIGGDLDSEVPEPSVDDSRPSRVSRQAPAPAPKYKNTTATFRYNEDIEIKTVNKRPAQNKTIIQIINVDS